MFISKPRLALAAYLLLALSARAAADEPGAKGLYGKALRSVCVVRAGDDLATGWLVDELDRLVVTSAHVAGARVTVEVVFPAYRGGSLIAEADYYLKTARAFKARVVDVSARDHLALIQVSEVPAGARELKLASASPGPGDRVHAVGNPGANEPFWLYATGTVRSVYQKKWTVRQSGVAYALETRVIETQAPANAGDSGGPLLNDAGELVGVSVGGEAGAGVSRFVEAARVRDFLGDSRPLVLPLNADEFAERGRRHLNRGCLDAALADLSRALKRDPKNVWAYSNRAVAFNRRGDAATAIADADRALQLNPKLTNAFFERAYAKASLRRHEDAIADYTRVIELQPEHVVARNNRGHSSQLLGRDQEALRDYSEAIRLDPNYGLAYVNRGHVRMKLKEHREAVADFTQALQRGYRRAETLHNRGWAYIETKEYDEALKDLAEALKLDPNSAGVWLDTGVALAGKKLWQGALKAYNQAIVLKPRYALAYYNRGAVYANLEQAGLAHQDYEEAVRLQPEYAGKVPVQDMRYLKVVNKSAKTIRVYLRYESKTKEGNWFWYHSGANDSPPYWVIAPGQTIYPAEKGWRVKARRVRIWAVTTDGTGNWLRDRDQDVSLVAAELRSQSPPVFTYTFE